MKRLVEKRRRMRVAEGSAPTKRARGWHDFNARLAKEWAKGGPLLDEPWEFTTRTRRRLAKREREQRCVEYMMAKIDAMKCDALVMQSAAYSFRMRNRSPFVAIVVPLPSGLGTFFQRYMTEVTP